MHQGLLQDIREHPWDDTPRLILADWLEDHEQESWAAYIRNAVEKDRCVTLGAGDSLRFQGKQIFRVPSGRGRTPEGHREKWLIRHGLIEAVETTCKDWLRHGPELVEQQPVGVVRLSDKEPGEHTRVWVWRLDDERERRMKDVMGRFFNEKRLLPATLFPHVRKGFLEDCSFERAYVSRDSALQHLSAGCLAWAREQAKQQEVCHA